MPNRNTIRAKVYCATKIDDQFGTNLRFSGVSDNSGENKAFTDATPNLDFNLTIAKGKPAADSFERGKQYYVDFTPADNTAGGIDNTTR